MCAFMFNGGESDVVLSPFALSDLWISHSVETAREGVDFFQNPLADRGTLRGISAEFCLLQVDEDTD